MTDPRPDPLRVHLVTLVVYGAALGAVLFVVVFPRLVLFFAILAVGAIAYVKLYGIVEKKLALYEADLFDEPLLEPLPLPARRRKKKAAPRPPAPALEMPPVDPGEALAADGGEPVSSAGESPAVPERPVPDEAKGS